MALTRLDLIKDCIPAGILRNDDANAGHLRVLVSQVLQPVLELLYQDLDRFAAQIDPDTADSNTVAAMLGDLGNPFDVALTLPLPRQRLLVKSLLEFYKQNGTGLGLIKIVRALTGVEITSIISPAQVRGWILGRRVLGDTGQSPGVNPAVTNIALLGPSGTNVYSFQIAVDRVLTDQQRATIRQIVMIVKPCHTHFYGIVEPGSGSQTAEWELGAPDSKLGQNTTLG